MYKLIHNSQILEIFETEEAAKKYLINTLLKSSYVNYAIEKYHDLYDTNDLYLDSLNHINNLIKEKKYDDVLSFFHKDIHFGYCFSYSIKEIKPISKVSIKRPKGMQKYLDKQNKLAIFK